MGLLDNLVNSALNSVSGNPAGASSIDGILKAAGSLLQSQGGLGNLVSQFDKAGLGHIVQSWIGTGQNAAISGAQLTQALGSDKIGQIAQQLGVDHSQAGNLLAQYLPQLVDHLTPNGQMPASGIQNDMLGNALSMLKGKLLG